MADRLPALKPIHGIAGSRGVASVATLAAVTPLAAVAAALGRSGGGLWQQFRLTRRDAREIARGPSSGDTTARLATKEKGIRRTVGWIITER